MAIAVATIRQSMANHYGTLGNYFGLCTGNPGTSTTPANEVTGTGPEGAYTRVQGAYSAGSGGVGTYANPTINAPATGSVYTVTHITQCSAATGATQINNAALTSSITIGPMGGVIVLSGLTYTQT